LAIDNEEKTNFITPFEIFCYTKMAFILKNGGATYQTGMQIVLEPLIRRNVEAYIDDVVVKLKKHADLLDNLKETFDNLHNYQMKLYPKNVYLVFHQGSCSATWCRLGGSMLTQRKTKPLNYCNRLEHDEKSRS
jgi:hypothetical protein